MTRSPDDIEATLQIPEAIAAGMLAVAADQDQARGDWPSPRKAVQPAAPWPALDNAALRFLIHKAKASLAAGMDQDTALLQLAVHAWFESGIENYDRGQRDARRPRPVQ
jgi:anti-sigma factor RsiW